MHSSRVHLPKLQTEHFFFNNLLGFLATQGCLEVRHCEIAGEWVCLLAAISELIKKKKKIEICGLQLHDIMIVSWKAFCRSLIIQRCERDGRTPGKQNIWMASWRRSYLKDCFSFFSLRWVTFALQLCDHCFFFSQCSRRKKSTVLTVLNETVARIIFVTWAQREGGCDRSSLSPYTTCSFICARQGEKYILCDHSQPDFCHLLLVPSKSAPKKDKGDTRSVSLREKPHRFLLVCLNQPIFHQTLCACGRICVSPPPFKAARMLIVL